MTVLQAEAYAAALVELETAKAKALNVTIQAETDVLIYNKKYARSVAECCEVLRSVAAAVWRRSAGAHVLPVRCPCLYLAARSTSRLRRCFATSGWTACWPTTHRR